MQINITKSNHRTQLEVIRDDGSSTRVELGVDLPYHDLAHYVVESYLGMMHGFYGNVNSGRTMQEMNEGDMIRGLPPEVMVAEVLTRNLQAIHSGASTPEQFLELVKWELDSSHFGDGPDLTLKDVQEMEELYLELIERWETLREQEVLELKMEMNQDASA